MIKKSKTEKGEKDGTFVLAKAKGGESLGKVKVCAWKHRHVYEMKVRLPMEKRVTFTFWCSCHIYISVVPSSNVYLSVIYPKTLGQ